MVAADGDNEFSIFCVIVYLLTDFLGDCAGEFGAFHAAVVWVVRGQQLGVVVDCAVEVNLHFQIFLELLDEASLNQGLRSGINTGFGLCISRQLAVLR